MSLRTVKEIESFYSLLRQQSYEQTGMIADILFLLDEIKRMKEELHCLNCGDLLTGKNYKFCEKFECQDAKNLAKSRRSSNKRHPTRRVFKEKTR